MIQGKGSRRVSLSALRFPYVKKQKENIESSKNNPSKRRCFERKMKYAAASWPSIIETQLYSFSAILVFHPIFLKYRSRDCSVTGCRNDVQKRAPFLSLSLFLSSTLLSRSSIFWNSREFIYELQSLTEVNSWYEIFFSRAEIWLYSGRIDDTSPVYDRVYSRKCGSYALVYHSQFLAFPSSMRVFFLSSYY